MKKTLISFIIPHNGREGLLHKTIESITLQEFDLSLIEVIIVTQNDRLSEEILRFDKLLNLSVYPRPVTDTISSLRNFGAEKANGEYFAFIDADIRISPDWTNSMLEQLHSDKQRVLVSAIQSNSPSANSIEKIRTALNNVNRDSNVDSLDGKNLFLTHKIFRLAGGFPNRLQTCEDIYFTNKVGKLGFLYLTSKATFVHLGEDKDYTEMFKKEIWRGLNNLHSFQGRRVPFRELPSILIPVTSMPLFFLSLVALIQGFYIPSLVLICLMLSPVIAYSIRLSKYSRNHDIQFIDFLIFYMVYFTARSIGVYKGIYKSLMKTKP